MRIAYVGNFEPEFSTENDVRHAFEYLGHEVDPVQENKTPSSSLFTAAREADLLLWTSTWDDAVPLEVAQEVFAGCRERGVPTATYHLDVFFGVSREGRNWKRNPMMHTDFVCTAEGGHEELFAEAGIKHHWLRAGVRHTACHPGTPRAEYACDVALTGSDGHHYHPEWKYRIELVDELEKMCARRGWTFKNPGGREEKVPRGEEMNDFYASASVTVGDSLCLDFEKSMYWSDRAYEAPGRGGLLIMPQIDALAQDYDDQMEMYPWYDWEKLEWLISTYLTSPQLRAVSKMKTWDIATERHTYVQRMGELLRIVGLT